MLVLKYFHPLGSVKPDQPLVFLKVREGQT